MKRYLFGGILAVACTCAIAQDTGWSYQYATPKHAIRVSCPAPTSNACTYEVWNRPRTVGQGKADLVIENGRHELFANGNSQYVFTSGKVRIALFDSLRDTSENTLTVYVDGRLRSRYPLEPVSR